MSRVDHCPCLGHNHNTDLKNQLWFFAPQRLLFNEFRTRTDKSSPEILLVVANTSLEVSCDFLNRSCLYLTITNPDWQVRIQNTTSNSQHKLGSQLWFLSQQNGRLPRSALADIFFYIYSWNRTIRLEPTVSIFLIPIFLALHSSFLAGLLMLIS